MSTSFNNLGEYLAAEIKGQLHDCLSLAQELNAQIAARGIETPVADETVWEKTLDLEDDKPASTFNKSEHIDRPYPPSLYG
jgi:hypothetical protein